MAKVVRKDLKRGETSITYPLWPGDGEATATITEWENGEGYDIDLDGTVIELTNFELTAVQALAHLRNLEYFMEQKAYKRELLK